MNRQQKRKLRTRNLLKETTERLLIEHGYHALTVQQITDSADLARGTFYVHFADKEAVVWELLEEMLRDLQQLGSLAEPFAPDDVRYAKWLNVFKRLETYRPLLGTILGPKGDTALVGRFQQFATAIMVEGLARNRVPFLDALPRPFAASFLAGGLTQILVWWFEQDAGTVSAETINAHFCSIIMPQGEAPTV